MALLQGELRALHDAQSAGLERCATGLDRCSGRIDAVESSVGAAHTWIERQAAAGGGPALPPALPLEPGVAPAEFKVTWCWGVGQGARGRSQECVVLSLPCLPLPARL